MSESLPPDPTSCVVLVPVGWRVEPAVEDGLRELERRGYAVRREYGHSAIDAGRNVMAARALRDGFDELMWIDADVAFSPDDVERLRRHGRPITCGIYPKKGPRSMAANFPPGTREVRFGRDGGLVRVAQVGFGFVHTRRQAYEQIAERCRLPLCNETWNDPLHPFFWPMVKSERRDGRLLHHYYAEDDAFCERAAEAGLEIWADTRLRLWHVGPYRYGWEDAGRDIERYGDYTYHIGRGPDDPGLDDAQAEPVRAAERADPVG